jgi:hypothetical protein
MRIQMSALFLFLLAAAGTAVAGEQFDPAARANTIAPFIDAQTFAVLHLDVSRVPVDKVVALIGKLNLALEEEPGVRQQMEMVHTAFTHAGGKDLYVVVSMADLPWGGPFVVVPLAAGADQKALAKLFEGAGHFAAERIGRALVVGPAATIARLKNIKPDPRPDLVKAFQAAGDTAAQAVLIPLKYTARVIEQMLPTLPPEVGDGPSSVLTQGLLWAAAGADVFPQPSLNLVIQSQDNQAAKALREKWVALLQFAGKQREVREKLPAFDKLAALVTPQVQGDRLTLTFDEENQGIASLISLLKGPIAEARAAAMRAQSMNNLKQIGLAMWNYHDAHKHFPAAASYDAHGKPLLSWRVQILPFLECEVLYEQFHLDEPWDSEHNRKLIDQMPAVYRSPASKLKEKGRTSYLVPVGKDTVFPGREGIPLKEIKDGTSKTIIAVEVDDQHAVIWTKPEDLPFDPNNPAKGLGGLYPGGFSALFCDGSVRFVKLPEDPSRLRAMFTRAGKDSVSP